MYDLLCKLHLTVTHGVGGDVSLLNLFFEGKQFVDVL